MSEAQEPVRSTLKPVTAADKKVRSAPLGPAPIGPVRLGPATARRLPNPIAFQAT